VSRATATAGDRVVTPGDLVTKSRRVGVILDCEDGKYTVLSAKGTEVWKPEDCRRGGNPATGVTYAIRALEVVKGRESKAVTDLEVLRRTDAKQRALITRVAHTQGTSHGLDTRLDDMLSRHGLDRRPVPMHRWVAVHLRHTYTGSSPAAGVGSLLGTDTYATLGRVPQRIVVDKVRLVQMPVEELPFRDLAECTCETDAPDPAAVEAQLQTLVRIGAGWETTVLGQRMAFTSESRSGGTCRHNDVFAAMTTWEAVFPDAELIAAPSGVPTWQVGDRVRITRTAHGLEQGWEFNVTGVRESDGRLFAASDEHPREGRNWIIRPENCVRMNVRIGDEVVVTQEHLSLALGARFEVTALTETGETGPRGLRYEGRRVSSGLPDDLGWTMRRDMVERVEVAAARVTEMSPF